MKQRLCSFVLVLALVLGIFSVPFTLAGATAPEYQLNLNREPTEEGIVFCEDEAILLTVTAENYAANDRVMIFEKDDATDGTVPPIKYALMKNVVGKSVNLRTFRWWVDSSDRSAFKSFPAADYKIVVCKDGSNEVEAELFFTVSSHNWVLYEAGWPADCQHPGLEDSLQCTRCQKIQEGDPIPKTGHVYGEWVVTKTPTCIEEGVETRYCIYDKNHKEERSISKINEHRFELTLITPSTTEHAGLLVNRCSLCGIEKEDARFPVPQIAEVSLNQTSYTCDNTEKRPAVTVKDADGNLIIRRYFTISYENNISAGTGKVIVTFQGVYAGSVTLPFTIALTKPTVRVSKTTANTATLKWSAVEGAKYYRIYVYNTKTKTHVKLANTSSLTYTVKKLSPGTTSYYLVRAYTKNEAGKQVLGPGTKADNVKVITRCKTPAVKVKISGKNVNLKWAKVTGAKYYSVCEYNLKTKKYSTIVKKTTKLTVTLKSRTKGTHYYLVKAFNANAKSNVYTTKDLKKAIIR